MISAVPRSGSTLLIRSLEATGRAGRPAEYFNAAYEPYASWKDLPLRRYVDFLERARSTPNGVFGFKIFFYQYEETWAGRHLEDFFPGLRFLYIRRRDHLRQAVSFARAIQTRQWDSDMVSTATPSYDGAMIERRLQAIETEEQGWRSFFEERSIAPLEIVYEDFVTSYGKTIQRVMRHLELELSPGSQIPEPSLEKQGDALSEKWVAQFRESHPEFQ